MEKFYIVKNEKILQRIAEYLKNKDSRNVFINDFFQRYNIDGESYYLGGTGFMNEAFDESCKTKITLCIEDTANNLSKFGSALKKTKHFEGLSEFKKNSSVLKALQQECIDKKIIINLSSPYWGDYIDELHYGGFKQRQFGYNGDFYLSLEKDNVETMTPNVDGFVEINGSQFYSALELKEKEDESEQQGA